MGGEKPRLLDAFSGAGGCSAGYAAAGFEVVGCDHAPQPNYPYEFHQADALEFIEAHGHEFDCIAASPPCQKHANVTKWRGEQADHPELIAPTRELLEATGLPYVIENVDKAPLRADFMLCGTMFGLPIRRHRYFETNWADLHLTEPCQHRSTDLSFDHGGKQPESVYRDAMEVPWMTVKESRQAIPPAFTRWIGERLAAHLTAQKGTLAA